MTILSVNINKIATLRNARGGNMPDVEKAAADIESYGAQGITVHPRPDGRHILYSDVRKLKNIVHTEFNIEGNPEPAFRDLVMEVVPDQVTLVPDGHDAITSNSGWDTIKNAEFLQNMCNLFHSKGIRVSIFVDPIPEMAYRAAKCGADRIELYTAHYAEVFPSNPQAAVLAYKATAHAAKEAGLGVNAGHDLNLDNLGYLLKEIPYIDEVSIGHALICDALYMGLEKTVKMYLAQTHVNK